MPDVTNPFDDIEDDDLGTEEEVVSQAGGDNANFQKLRAAYKQSEKERKAFEKELAELRDFRASVENEKRTSMVKEAFEAAGLPETAIDIFLKVNGDAEITAEAVQSFAAALGHRDPVTDEPVAAPEPKPQGFNPQVHTGGATPDAGRTYTPQEVLALGLPEAEIVKLEKAGRIERAYAKDDNGYPVVDWLAQA